MTYPKETIALRTQRTVARNMARSRAVEFNKLGLVLIAIGLTGLLALSATGSEPAGESIAIDAAGDADFPYDVFDGPVPPYLDVVKASVSLRRGVFHFELKMSSDIPADADPGLRPAVNHLGATFGILTDRATAGSPSKFFGQNDVYWFNYLVGAVYSVTDSGVGLELGWKGFLLSNLGFVEIPIRIKQDTLILEVNAAVLGNPTSFNWAVGSECDPVSIPDEKMKTVVIVDYVPDHGVASWPPQD